MASARPKRLLPQYEQSAASAKPCQKGTEHLEDTACRHSPTKSLTHSPQWARSAQRCCRSWTYVGLCRAMEVCGFV